MDKYLLVTKVQCHCVGDRQWMRLMDRMGVWRGPDCISIALLFLIAVDATGGRYTRCVSYNVTKYH